MYRLSVILTFIGKRWGCVPSPPVVHLLHLLEDVFELLSRATFAELCVDLGFARVGQSPQSIVAYRARDVGRLVAAAVRLLDARHIEYVT